MSNNTPPLDDETFNQAYAIISEDRRPLDTRIGEVLDEIEGTDLDARDVLITYGATLRENDPLDSNNRRVSTLITTAQRYDIHLNLEEIIDAAIDGNTGAKVATSISSPDDDDGVKIVDRSQSRTEVSDSGSLTFDIDLEDQEAVENAAVTVYQNKDLSLQEKREHLKKLLQKAKDHGVDVNPSDVRAAINEHREDSAEESTGDDIDPSEVTPGPSETPERKPEQAHLTITDTSISSTGIHAGETVRVSISVENTGDSVGIKDLRISQNHEVIKKESVTVEPGETTTHTSEILFETGGQHLLQVNDDHSTSITVLSPADVVVTSLETDTTRVAPDDSTTVTATLENSGDLTGSIELELVVGEHLFETQDVKVDGNSTHEETFEFELERPGTYSVSVGRKTLEITALKPASVNVTDYRLSSTGLELGEELSVTVDVENTGDLDGTIAVALYANGSTIETRSVELEGQDTRTINFTTEFERTGSHTVSINNLEQTDVTVLKPASATVREFDIVESSIGPTETVSVIVTLDNTGDLSDTQTLNISVNGDVIQTENVEIPGNETESFTISPDGDIELDFAAVIDSPGDYSISINGLPSQTLEVLEPADVNVRYYSLSSDEVVPGEEFETNVEIENIGDVAGDTEIEIFINNELIETRTVEVQGNSDKRGTFKHTLDEPGTYTVVVNNLDPSELTVRGTGEFNVTDVEVNTNTDDLHVGDTLSLTINAENTTSLNSEQTTTVYLGGVEIASEIFQLPGNSEDTFGISTTVDQPGVYNLEVDDTVITTIEVTPEIPVVDLTNEDYIASITQCIKQTDDGTRCTRDVEEDTVLCWQHEESFDDLDPLEIEDCQYTTPDDDVCQNAAETGGILCSEHNPLEEAFEPELIEDVTEQRTDDDSDVEWGEPLEEDTLDPDSSADEGEDTDTIEPAETTPEPDQKQRSTEPEDPVKNEQAPDPDERHKRTVSGPDNTEGKFNQQTNTRTVVNFDFVLDSNEDILPNDVDGAGLLVDGDEYVGIAEVQPRSWSIHTPEEKQQIINQYRTMFLGSLDFPVQIVCYPTEFDISEHITALEKQTQKENVRDDESYLLNIGRQVYPNWLREYISRSQMKQRNFYIVVRVKPEQLNQFRQSDGGVLDTIDQRAPAIANLLRKVVPGSGKDEQTKDVTRQDCLMEMHDRLQRLESALNPMGVNVDPITSRDKAMTVLYQYYNNKHPIVDTFDVATRSEHAPTMHIDEEDWPLDGMNDIHYEGYSSGDSQ